MGSDEGLHHRHAEHSQAPHHFAIAGRGSRDQAPAVTGAVLPLTHHLFQQLWEDGELLLHSAPGQGQSLPFIAGSGGLGYGDMPRDIQPGGIAFAHVKHVRAEGWGTLLTSSSREAAGATGYAALMTKMSSSSSSSEMRRLGATSKYTCQCIFP